MVTAADDLKKALTSFKQGVDGYITKPFNRETIFAELEKIMQRPIS